METEKVLTRCEVESVGIDMMMATTADEDVDLAAEEGIGQEVAVVEDEEAEVAVAAGSLHHAQKVVHVLALANVTVIAKGPSLTLLLPTRPGIRQTSSSRKIVNDELSECMF